MSLQSKCMTKGGARDPAIGTFVSKPEGWGLSPIEPYS